LFSQPTDIILPLPSNFVKLILLFFMSLYFFCINSQQKKIEADSNACSTYPQEYMFCG